MSTTINDIAKLLKSDDKKGDTSFWGIVHSTIEDGEGNVTGYNVSLDGSANGAVKCNKVVGAKQGDQVLVTLRANGEAVVVATKGGDTDVQDVATNLDTNYYDKDEVDEKIAEVEGGSYQIIEWARSSSTSTAPTTGWSTTMPTLTTSYPYLWQRIVTVTGETRTAGTPQRAETMDGLYVFKNQAQTGSATVINGGAIDTSTLYLGRIQNGAGNYASVDSSGLHLYSGSSNIANFGSDEVTLCGGAGKVGADSIFGIAILGGTSSAFSYLELNGQDGFHLSGRDVVDWSTYTSEIWTSNGEIYLKPGNSNGGVVVQSGYLSCSELYVNGQPITPGGSGVDYVTAQGVSNGWSYRKWYSGKCELWRSYTDTFAMSTSYNGGYSSSAAITLTLPFSVDNAVCTGTGHSAGNMVVASASGTTFSFRPFRMSSGSSVSRTFYFRIDGTYY